MGVSACQGCGTIIVSESRQGRLPGSSPQPCNLQVRSAGERRLHPTGSAPALILAPAELPAPGLHPPACGLTHSPTKPQPRAPDRRLSSKPARRAPPLELTCAATRRHPPLPVPAPARRPAGGSGAGDTRTLGARGRGGQRFAGGQQLSLSGIPATAPSPSEGGGVSA